MKKKKATPSKSGKTRDRSPLSGDEIISARDKFKGALQDLLPHSDDESDLSDDELWTTKSKRMALQKKKLVEKQLDQDFNKYVMKLYDRSVDLAQFNENTPLYPICRAWIANQPHNVYNLKKEDLADVKDEVTPDDVDWDGVRDIYHLPAPDATEKPRSSRVPDAIPYISEYPDIPKEGSEPPRDSLLMDNLNHWRQVRRSWMVVSTKNDTRYKKSISILSSMYNKAQKQFQN